VGAIQNITIDNVIAYAQGTSRMVSNVGKPLANIRLSNIQVKMEPEATPDKRTTHAMLFSGVDGLRLHNVKVTWNDAAPEPGWQSGLVFQKVNNLQLYEIEARQGPLSSSLPALSLTDCTKGVISTCIAQPGTGTFLAIDGSATGELIVHANYLTNARTPLLLDKTVPKGKVVVDKPFSKPLVDRAKSQKQTGK
jgi:hypothetical protein